MSANRSRLPAVLILALGLPAMIACGSGGGGGTSPTVDNTAQQISNEELSRMVLSLTQLPPEYPPMEPDEENGVLTLDKAVESFYDPEGLREQLVGYGWESGYEANYKVPDGDKARHGPAFVLTRVEVYQTSDGAAAKINPPASTDGSGSARTLSPSDAAHFAERFHRFEVHLGDEAGGFRLRDKVTGEDNSDVLWSAFVTFRRGRLIGQVSVAAYNLSDKEAKELEDTVTEMASNMNDQMSAVLAQSR